MLSRIMLLLVLLIMPTRSPGEDTMAGNSKSALDTRATVPPYTLNTPRKFPKIKSLAEWEARKADIRKHVAISLGLYPMPAKTAMYPKIFGRIERDGYTIEKVSIETYPGFFLAGNLYRPLNPKSHSHPGILVTHGHWEEGRMADEERGSIAARAITLSREGCTAFTYDMVGYNDTRQINHQYANTLRHWLWGISLMGLQTWISVRALDFLCTLPEVDQKKLAITGESGGGTQTMMLGAIDSRLAAVGPCVMVSHSMQGGCLCENAPGLRVDYSNMEIAASAAPLPQVMTSATGDWTKTMLTIEGPAVASIYSLYQKPEQVRYQLVDAPHNINKESREIVNKFFGKWLLGDPIESHFIEPSYKMEPLDSLRVYPLDKPLPKNALSADQLTNMLIWNSQQMLESKLPKRITTLKAFTDFYKPAWKHTLNIEVPSNGEVSAKDVTETSSNGYTTMQMNIGRKDRGDSIPAVLYSPTGQIKSDSAIVLTSSEGIIPFTANDHTGPGPLAERLLSRGHQVLLLDCFLTGSRANAAAEAARNLPFGEYFSTYNRTDMQERVQDLITAAAYLRKDKSVKKVKLIGKGKAGLWSLLAAPAFQGTAADCNNLDLTKDDSLLTQDMFVPGLRKMGDFQTAAILAADFPLYLFQYDEKFLPIPRIKKIYRFSTPYSPLSLNTITPSDTVLADWVDQT